MAVVPADRRLSMSAAQGPATARISTRSSATGCYISAPISPPIGYPLPAPSPGPSALVKSPTLTLDTPRSSARSSSSGSSNGSGSQRPVMLPPRWAMPPARAAAIAGQAKSAVPKQDVDFDQDLFEGTEGEWVEVIKGEEGRIAVKSTATQYEVMVWLPGFSLDDITITTRKHQTLHIVADQWDEADHAQWEIKLGPDAIMSSIRADFDKRKLTVRISRGPGSSASRSFRSGSSSSSAGQAATQPSIVATPSSAASERTAQASGAAPRDTRDTRLTAAAISRQAATDFAATDGGLALGMDVGEQWRMEARISRGWEEGRTFVQREHEHKAAQV